MNLKNFLTVISVVIVVGLIIAGLSDKQKTPENSSLIKPEETLHAFLEADLAGARLGGQVAQKAPPINSYLGFIYEGEKVIIVDKYKIIDFYLSPNRSDYLAEVKYFNQMEIFPGFKKQNKKEGKVLKKWANGAVLVGYQPKERIQKVTFRLVQKTKNSWEIISPSVCPHISRETLGKHLKSLPN